MAAARLLWSICGCENSLLWSHYTLIVNGVSPGATVSGSFCAGMKHGQEDTEAHLAQACSEVDAHSLKCSLGMRQHPLWRVGLPGQSCCHTSRTRYSLQHQQSPACHQSGQRRLLQQSDQCMSDEGFQLFPLAPQWTCNTEPHAVFQADMCLLILIHGGMKKLYLDTSHSFKRESKPPVSSKGLEG